MSCARCDALAREAAELRVGVEAWRANDDEDRRGSAVDRLARWKAAIPELSPATLLTLMSLADRPGRVQSPDVLNEAMRASPFASFIEQSRRNASVRICVGRAALRSRGADGRLPDRFRALDGGVVNHAGMGWSMDRASATALKRLTGEG
ncbi:hypothetical protein [Brevundimonas sp. DC300-4]|uniref:hypothetical protein n=1 Tax=Brevundimonas sp. DC300-4 TaxID=2804594 RepID=UPI003CE846BF